MTSSTTWAFSSLLFSPRMILHFCSNTTTNCIASEILNCRSLLSAYKVPYFNFTNSFLLLSSTLHGSTLFKVTQGVLFCPYFIRFCWSWKFSPRASLFSAWETHPSLCFLSLLFLRLNMAFLPASLWMLVVMRVLPWPSSLVSLTLHMLRKEWPNLLLWLHLTIIAWICQTSLS